MAERKRIGLLDIRGLQENREIWDSAVPGFGARRQKGAAVAYILLYRTPEGRSRRYTIGRHGAPWTPDTARAEARRLLGEIVKGTDPAAEKKAKREAITVSELCDQYWAATVAGRLLVRGDRPKKASTQATDRGRMEGHIKPLLGNRKVAALTRDEITQFMHDVADGLSTTKRAKDSKSQSRGGRGTARRTVALLSAILSYAAEKGIRTDNPASRVRKFAEGKRDRRLSNEEFAALGDALRTAENEKFWPAAVACARFLALTGWRRGEALTLRWNEIDLERRTARLADTKTGASMRPLSEPICELLRGLPRTGDLVFAASRQRSRSASDTGTMTPAGAMGGYTKVWRRIAKLSELPADITPHVLRHSFSSIAGDLGYSEPTIAALIGHKGRSVTSRYVHSADAVLLAASDAVARHISGLMDKAAANPPMEPLTAAPSV